MKDFRKIAQSICQKHIATDNVPVKIEEDEWYEYIDEEGIARMKKRDKPIEEQIETLIRNAKIPKGYRNKNVSDYRVNDIQSYRLKKGVVDYVNNFIELKKGTGLYIYSEANGSGKTHIVCACAVSLIKTYRINVKFSTVTEMLNDIKESFENNTPVLKRYQECDLLVLDDFGSEKKTEWSEETLFTILDYREKNELPTLYTSNIDIDNLKYNNRIKSRIKGHSLKLQAGNEDNRKLVETLI